MKKERKQPAGPAALRRRAEQALRARPSRQGEAAGDARGAADTARLVQELQVHHIELEMQNEELRQANARVEALVAEYTDLYDFAPVGYLALDREGTIRQVNLTGARLLGAERSRLVKRRFGLFVAPSDRRVFSDFLAAVFTGDAKEWCEVTLTQAEHPTVAVRIEATRSEDGQECRAVVLDITDAKQATEALRESQARLAGIVASAMDGIVTVDEHGRVLLFNAAAEQAFGCLAAEAIGQPVERFIPHRFDRDLQAIDLIGATQPEPPRFLRSSGLRASGEEFPLEGSISSAAVDGHSLLTLIVRDVTARVRSEEARLQLEVQLRQVQKIEALGTLAGGIAHDFNNILGAIIGNTALASQDVGADHPAQESLGEISKASQRAKDLVQRILIFTSQHREPRSVIPLRPVVDEALTLLRAALPAGVEIAATFAADAPTVLADASQIHQILINLCTNAWHAMSGRAGRIDVCLDDIALDAAAAGDANLRPGRFARLRVSDTGTGMDAAMLERIFEPFFTTKPVGEGTGLGLSIVHGIVKAHAGAITVTSRPGEGTTFSVYLPAAEAAQHDAAVGHVAPPKPARAAGGRHVLYVDDEEALVFLVTRMLERLGYRVGGYTRAEEALAAVRADPTQVDLVVTDLNMPGMSGLDLARELLRLRPDLPVAIASGYLTEELRAQAIAAGVGQLIYKPNTIDELCEVVQRLAGEP